jgi:hypothetical protein
MAHRTGADDVAALNIGEVEEMLALSSAPAHPGEDPEMMRLRRPTKHRKSDDATPHLHHQPLHDSERGTRDMYLNDEFLCVISSIQVQTLYNTPVTCDLHIVRSRIFCRARLRTAAH